MSEATQKKVISLDMLSQKIDEAKKVLASITLLRDNDMEIPSTLVSQEEKCANGLEYILENGMPSTQEEIQETWIKFQGQRGRAAMSDAQKKIAFLDARKGNIREKIQKLADEYQALYDFRSDKESVGTTYTFTLPKGSDGEEANGSALREKLSEIEGKYFAIYRKESETSRRGTLVGGYLYESENGDISHMFDDLC